MKLDGQQSSSCVFGSLLLAAGVGLVAALLMIVLSNLGWPGSIFLAVVLAAILAALLLWIFCKPLPNAMTDGHAAASTSAGMAAAGATVAVGAAGAATARASDSDAKAAAAAKAKAEAKAKADKKAAAAKKTKAAANVDYDGDGVAEGANEGTKPATLKAARGGKADDLKMIKGVGPKMEKLCNKLGFYHFDQVASWTKAEVAWVDANLEGFRGRVSRDEWVKQAKILAKGGTTEFSKKVGKGGVY